MAVLFAVSFIQEKNSTVTLRQILDQKHFLVRYLLILIGILSLLVFGIYGPNFEPSAFVYMQF